MLTYTIPSNINTNGHLHSTHKATGYNGPWHIQSPGHSKAAYVMSIVEIRKPIFKRGSVICPGKPGLVPACLSRVSTFSGLWTR